jgi:hypothetical protein
MPDVLVAAAVLSLLFAVLMTVIAAKLLRENRARTTSRVEALQALAAAPATPTLIAPRATAVQDIPFDIPMAAAPKVMPATRSIATLPVPAEIDDTWDFDLRDEYVAEEPVPTEQLRRRTGDDRTSRGTHELFEAPIAPAPSRRWTWIAAAGLVMLLGGGTFWIVSSGVIGRALAAHDANITNANALPLELLSLRYASDPAGFVVTGLVQNPAKSVTLRGVVAVVYLFDAEGKYIANSRAPLESTVLSAGGESGFVVRLPAAADVTKYRVSFQHEDGAAVTHVDRRGALPENTTGDAVGSAADRSTLAGTVVRK